MFSFVTKKGLPASALYVVLRLLLIGAVLLVCACETGIYHTVKPGQTLYRISRTYGISETSLMRANGISDPTKVREGTRLFVPGADRVLSVAVVKPAETEKIGTPKISAPKISTPVKKDVAAPASKKTAVVEKSRVSTAKPVPATDIKKLQWPLRGKIVSSFSSAAKAGSGKGIEIAARSGSRVEAAEAGKVIYSGDGVNGYGHLIILQHENDLFTVYGFNQLNYVRQGDFVSKGEKIALSGVPSAGGTPRLHFEVRKGKQAVDPILYLP